MKIAIIGAGLAGTACAYVFKQAGAQPVIYEAGPEIAHGASGNVLGLYNPRFSAERDPQSEYYTTAFRLALQVFREFKNIDFNPCGALHLMNDEKKDTRFRKMIESWEWPEEDMRLIDAVEVNEIMGKSSHMPSLILHNAIFFKSSGMVSPMNLCQAYAEGAKIHFNTNIKNLQDIEADAIILACSSGVKNFKEAAFLPINTVRGQVTHVTATELSKHLKCCVCYGGYITPAVNGEHMVGSTFQRWLDHSDVLPEDDQDNLAKLEANISGLTEGMELVGHRAAVRSTSKDHFPIVGPLIENMYVSTAHASHGILSSLMAAHALADMILDRPSCLSGETIKALSPQRFQ